MGLKVHSKVLSKRLIPYSNKVQWPQEIEVQSIGRKTMNKKVSEKEGEELYLARSCRRRERAQRTVSKAREASWGWSSNKRRRVRHCGSSSSSMAETGFSQSKIIPTIAQIDLFDNQSKCNTSYSFSSSSFTH